jgi:putative lipoprotein
VLAASTGYAAQTARAGGPGGNLLHPGRVAVRRSALPVLGLMALAATLGGCQANGPEGITVAGTVTWAGDAALPPGATVSVQLRDISRADAPAPLLAMQEITSDVTPPVAFNLAMPANGIDPRARLSIGVRITAGDRLIYISDTVNPVPVTGPAGPVEVVVVPVARGDE